MSTETIKSSRQWIVFIFAGTLFILSQFYRSSVAVIAPDLIRDLSLDSWELSTVSASFFYAFALMQIPVGIFLDSIGPRITMTLLTFVAVIGALVFSHGESYYSLTAGRILLGIGMACNFMGGLKLITLWFNPKQFATLSALIVSIGTAGNIAAATPLVLLVQAMGWRNSFMTMGAATFLITLLFFLLVSDRPGAQKTEQTQKTSKPGIKDTMESARMLFGQKDFWIISFSTFCRYGIYASVQALWAGPYLTNVAGLSSVTAGNILLLMSMGLIIGCPLSGHLSDTIFNSRKKIIIPGLWGMIGILGVLVFLPPETGPVVLSILFFGFGLFSGSGQIMYAHIKELLPSSMIAQAITAVNLFTVLGAAIMTQLLGLMIGSEPCDLTGPGDFRALWYVGAIALAISCLLYAFVPESKALKIKTNSR